MTSDTYCAPDLPRSFSETWPSPWESCVAPLPTLFVGYWTYTPRVGLIGTIPGYLFSTACHPLLSPPSLLTMTTPTSVFTLLDCPSLICSLPALPFLHLRGSLQLCTRGEFCRHCLLSFRLTVSEIEVLLQACHPLLPRRLASVTVLQLGWDPTEWGAHTHFAHWDPTKQGAYILFACWDPTKWGAYIWGASNTGTWSAFSCQASRTHPSQAPWTYSSQTTNEDPSESSSLRLSCTPLTYHGILTWIAQHPSCLLIIVCSMLLPTNPMPFTAFVRLDKQQHGYRGNPVPVPSNR